MSLVLTIQDESLSGDVVNKLQVTVDETEMSVRDIISLRVKTEVDAYNNKVDAAFNGLVQPTKIEQMLNKPSKSKTKEVDAEKQIYVALDAFQKNGFFVIVDDEQVESLEHIVQLRENSYISFVKLTPLVGG